MLLIDTYLDKSKIQGIGVFSKENIIKGKKIKQIMESAVDLEVPNKVDYESGPNWGQIK